MAVEIATASELEAIGTDGATLADDYIVVQPIDCSDTVNWHGGLGFKPIGTSGARFSGSFDGQGFAITDLTINRPDEGGCGFFAWVSTGIITNFTITATITAKASIGIVCGYNADVAATIDNVGVLAGSSVTAEVPDYNATSGGFAGRFEGTISNCYTHASVTSTYNQGRVGGFVGSNDGTIVDCYSTGAATTGAGALGGFCASNSGTITNCFWDTESSGNLTSDGGTGQTTAQMQTLSTFSAWDIVAKSAHDAETWFIDEGNDYPRLYFENIGTPTPPAGAYIEATIPHRTGLDDFSLLVLVNDNAQFTSWWDEAENVAGRNAQAYLEDGTTRLPLDPVVYEHGTPIAVFRIKVPGTLPSSTKIRIYPPRTEYGGAHPSSPYGQYNAYPNHWLTYLPQGGGTDRTRNAFNADPVSAGNPTVGSGAALPIGIASTTYDGTDDKCEIPHNAAFNFGASTDFSLLSWLAPAAGLNGQLIEKADNGVNNYFGIYFTSPSNGFGRISSASVAPYAVITPPAQDVFGHAAATFDRDDVVTGYVNGAFNDSDDISSLGSIDSSNEVSIGFGEVRAYFEGDISELQIHKTLLSANWIAHEYDQTNDNLAFWGGWTFVPAGPPGDIEGDVAYTLDEFDVFSAGVVAWQPISGDVAYTLEDFDVFSAGVVAWQPISGDVAYTLDDFDVAATGSVTGLGNITGDVDYTLEDFDVAATGSVVISGDVAYTLEDFHVFASDKPPFEEIVESFATFYGAVFPQEKYVTADAVEIVVPSFAAFYGAVFPAEEEVLDDAYIQ